MRANPSGVWQPKVRGFNMAAIQPTGHVVHFTGQVAWDENETIVGLGDIEAQTRQCFVNIGHILTALGGRMEDIVSITTYYTHRTQLPAIQKVRTAFLKADAAPVSTSVMVAGLGHPDFLVELTPIAVIPEDRFRAPESPS
ncbi:MAG: RidA family protein [Rhizobiales bacterium]|nr:RidA family protein [Hyphomicrobiales bacterium]